MATNVADLFAQAVATQMPNVFYIAPPERGAVATYGNPFDGSKYDTGTGRNTIPSWMVDNNGGGDGNGGLGSNGPMPHVFLPRNPPEPMVGPDEGPAYVQATNDDPFQGVTPTVRTVDQQTGEAITRDAGASGRGDSVQTPLIPGWIAPEFIRGNPDRSSPDPASGYTQEELAAIANAKGTQYNPNPVEEFLNWYDSLSDGGAIKDTAAFLGHAATEVAVPGEGKIGAQIGGMVAGQPGALVGYGLAKVLPKEYFPQAWVHKGVDEVFNKQPVFDPEDYKPNTDITYNIDRIPPAPQETILMPTEGGDSNMALEAWDPVGDIRDSSIVDPIYQDNRWLLPTEGDFTDPANPEFWEPFTGDASVNQIADALMPMTDLGSISLNGGLDDSTLTDAEREAFEAYILGAQKGKG